MNRTGWGVALLPRPPLAGAKKNGIACVWFTAESGEAGVFRQKSPVCMYFYISTEPNVSHAASVFVGPWARVRGTQVGGEC